MVKNETLRNFVQKVRILQTFRRLLWYQNSLPLNQKGQEFWLNTPEKREIWPKSAECKIKTQFLEADAFFNTRGHCQQKILMRSFRNSETLILFEF